MHDVAGVDAVRDRALVEHDEPTVCLDVDGAAGDEAVARQLDPYELIERAQPVAVQLIDVGRQLVVRGEQLVQQLSGCRGGADLGAARRSPSDVHTDADDDAVCAGLGQHSRQLLAIEQQIVRPLERRRDACGAFACDGRREGDAPGEFVRM